MFLSEEMRVVSILLLLLLAVSAAPETPRARIERMVAAIGARAQALPAASLSDISVLANPSCSEAIEAMKNLTQGDICAPAIELLDDGVSAEVPEADRAMFASNLTNAYCTTDKCDSDLKALLAVAMAACTQPTMEQETDLRQANFYMWAMCSSTPANKVCLADWSLFLFEFNMMEKTKGNWTAAQLKKICTPCVDVIAHSAAAYASNATAPHITAYTVCDKVGSQYTYLAMQAVKGEDDDGSFSASGPGPAKLRGPTKKAVRGPSKKALSLVSAMEAANANINAKTTTTNGMSPSLATLTALAIGSGVSATANDPATAAMSAYLKEFCAPIIQRGMGIVTDAAGVAGEEEAAFGLAFLVLLCAKNDNQYCLLANAGFEEQYEAACDLTATNCSASCKAFVEKRVKSTGCCAEFFEWGLDDSDSFSFSMSGSMSGPFKSGSSASSEEKTIFSWCGVTEPNSCYWTNTITARVTGVDVDWFNKTEDVAEIFGTALAYRAGTFPLETNATLDSDNATIVVSALVGPLYQNVFLIENDIKSPYYLAGLNDIIEFAGWKNRSQPPTVTGYVTVNSGVMSSPLFGLVVFFVCLLLA